VVVLELGLGEPQNPKTPQKINIYKLL
jgi:hypothetical protein